MDKRATNHMDQETKVVHYRLEAWGRWAKSDVDHLGFPTRSVTERANEGGIGAGSPRPPIDMPDEIALVDGAIAKLGDIDRKVIHRVYRHWESPEDSARALHMRVRGMQAVLKRARWRVSGYLLAHENRL